MPSRVVVAVLAASGVWPVLATELTEAKPGLLAVDVADDLALRDEARNRSVPAKAFFPASGGPYPVIVFSHGFGGNRG